jgi:hypothetical protein
MAENEGLQFLIKRCAPKAMCTHCMIRLCPELSEVLDAGITTVNYIKTRPFKSRLFAESCEEIGAQHQSLQFHCNSCWPSRGNVVAHVYNLRE